MNQILCIYHLLNFLFEVRIGLSFWKEFLANKKLGGEQLSFKFVAVCWGCLERIVWFLISEKCWDYIENEDKNYKVEKWKSTCLLIISVSSLSWTTSHIKSVPKSNKKLLLIMSASIIKVEIWSKKCSKNIFELIFWILVSIMIISRSKLRGPVFFRPIPIIRCSFLFINEVCIGITNFFENLFSSLHNYKCYLRLYFCQGGSEVLIFYKLFLFMCLHNF